MASFYGLAAGTCSLAIFGIWALYAHPRTMWKAVPILSSVLHLGGGMAMFTLGNLYDRHVGADGLAVSLFLTLSFVAGHLNHQVMDHDADAAAGLRTTAVFLGPKTTFDLSLAVYLGAYVVLVMAWTFGALGARIAAPFSAIAIPHVVVHLLYRRTAITHTAGAYQRVYRGLFLAAGLSAIGASIMA
jgi:4-hydroxybenzoate polyprenyltransferase